MKKNNFLKYGVAALGAFIAIAVSIVLYKSNTNPLPKDEEMIVLFREHRGDIEELVKRFREYTPSPSEQHSGWLDQDNTRELMSRAELSDIANGATPLWLPDPYASNTEKRIADMPGFEKYYRYSNISITLADPRFHLSGPAMFGMNVRSVSMFKDLYFFPEVPRIEGGFLIDPPNKYGKSLPSDRVYESLDDFPAEWRLGTCALRRIDPKWFIRMCKS